MHCFVDSCAALRQEISEVFSFYVDNYKYMPKFKARQWDGQIRLFNPTQPLLMLGHVSELLEWAKNNKENVEFEDAVKRQVINKDYSEEKVDKFLDGFNIVLNNGKSINFYEEQRKAIHLAIKYKRRLLLSPTSSGKSLICFAIIEWHMRHGMQQQALVTVPTITLTDQMKNNFIEYMDDKCLMKPEDIHVIKGGTSKLTNKSVIISTWQSIYKLKKSWFKNIELSILDEAHLAKGQSLQKMSEKMVNAQYKIGMTGTLDGTQVHRLVVEGCTGRAVEITTNKKMMDQGKTTPIKINYLYFDYPKDESMRIKSFKYQDEIKYIIHHDKRNQVLCKLLAKTKGNTLVLFNNIVHGERMYEEFLQNHPNKKCYLLHGSFTADQRNDVIDIMEKDDDIVTFASYGIFSTGVSINNIHNVVLGSPTKSRIRLLQSIGRGLRLAEGKQFVTLWDIVDDFTYLKRGGKNTHYNYAYDHGTERLKIYISQEFQYRISKLKIGNKNYEQ